VDNSLFVGSRWTKKAALILDLQGRVEQSKSTIFSAAFYVQREVGLQDADLAKLPANYVCLTM
jgi:hypothetical protein